MFSHISTLLSNEYRRASHEMRYLVFIRLVKDDEKNPAEHTHSLCFRQDCCVGIYTVFSRHDTVQEGFALFARLNENVMSFTCSTAKFVVSVMLLQPVIDDIAYLTGKLVIVS